MNRARDWRQLSLLAVVIGSTWLLRHSPGTSDVDFWLNWMGRVAADGPARGYAAIDWDYPPGSALVLWFTSQIAVNVGGDPRVVLKLVLVAFLLLFDGLLLLWFRRTALVAFAHITLVLGVAGLMYLDVLTAPFLLGAAWAAATRRPPLMLAFLWAACFIKWQPFFVMPFAVLHVLLQRPRLGVAAWRTTMLQSGAVLAVLTLLAVAAYGTGPLASAFSKAAQHMELSGHALNPLWIVTSSLGGHGPVAILPASPSGLVVVRVIMLSVYGTILLMYFGSRDATAGGVLRFATAGYLAYFLAAPAVHENHLVIASILSIALTGIERRWLPAALAIACAANANLLLFYGWRGAEVQRPLWFGIEATVWVAVVVSAGMLTVVWRLVSARPRGA